MARKGGKMHKDVTNKHEGVSVTIPATAEEMYKYEYNTRVTFCHTNAEGNVSHDQYAILFGIVRECFGLDFIPNFATEAGRKYLLKTRNASYEYNKEFVFGDVMKIRLWVKELTNASFTLAAEYINATTGEVHARGRQQIVYTDITGKPRRIPADLKSIIQASCPRSEKSA